VRNGDPWHSDHRPLIISMDYELRRRQQGQGGDTGFKFEAAWLEEENWRDVVKEAWRELPCHMLFR
jgi:hypothetical protein